MIFGSRDGYLLVYTLNNSSCRKAATQGVPGSLLK